MTAGSNDERARGLELPSHDKVERLQARFAAKTERVGDCLEWRGTLSSSGYGVTAGGHFGRGRVYTHRVAWVLANGSLPDRVIVRHRCDNPICVEPAHLTTGTTADNNADTLTRWTGPVRYGTWTPRGTAHRSAKLDEEKVGSIRRRYAKGEATMSSLAREYGVALQSISLVIQRRSWSHVE